MDPQAYVQKMIATMKERTGRSLEEWVAEVKPNLPAEKKGRVKWLKETYGLGQNTAMVLLSELENGGAEVRREAEAAPAEDRFQGENAPVRPLYEKLEAEIKALGSDVLIRPCKGYVPFYRKKVFVYLKPLKGKLYVALALPESTEHPRLEPIGKLGGPERIKLQAVVTGPADLDAELLGLIRQAYELN